MRELEINGDLSELSMYADDELTRAVIISLFSWARARDDDQVEGSRRFGFWGDTYDEAGQETGSRLWLMSRSKILPDTVERCRKYAAQALQWLVDDGVADSVDVQAERNGLDRIDMQITINRKDDDRRLRFSNVWEVLKNGV